MILLGKIQDFPFISRYTDVEYPDFDFEAQEIYMPSCVSCPPNYPWVGNPDGELRSVTKNILNNLS